MTKAFICGLHDLKLSDREKDFLRESQPAGIILFARNVDCPDQLRSLIFDVRSAIGRDDVLVLIDQEGGRVQRLRPPHWPIYPSASAYRKARPDNLEKACEDATLIAMAIAYDLHELGINTTCAPVLDMPVAGANQIIGNRAFGQDVDTIVLIGEAFAQGLLIGGVLPVIKHIPGHGRAMVDSHLDLPVIETSLDILRETDFVPFAKLNHLPMAMTAHLVINEIDRERPVTLSSKAIETIIRGDIGFDGLLMSDDISMKALAGPIFADTQAALKAGCDIVLHCNGDFAEMEAVANACGSLEGEAKNRFDTAFCYLTAPEQLNLLQIQDVLRETLAASS